MKWKYVSILLAVVVIGGIIAGLTVTNLTRQLDHLEADYHTLLSRVGDLESVEQEIATLKEELESLRAEREPLVPQTYRGSFLPTGSMEPKITALDEALWLDNFFPQDVIIGAVISFTPPHGHDLFDPKDPLRRVAHRVIEIKVEDGVHYYKTRGDNNHADDGWMSSSWVHSYITELYVGVIDDLPLVDLQSQILELNPLEHLLMREVEDLAAQYDQALTRYRNYVARHCPGYVCPPVHYQEASVLYDRAEKLRLALNARIAEHGSILSQIESLREEMSRLLDQRQ